jgi:coenzyme F420-0:L-glutamate ligase/coenzyme F420-1:gamma-L-glutamate ligase
VLPPGDDGPGAASLLRPEGADLFGLGAREAVMAALRRSPSDAAPFGSPLEAEELRHLLAGLTGLAVRSAAGGLSVATTDDQMRWVVEVAAYAHGWAVTESSPTQVSLQPVRG